MHPPRMSAPSCILPPLEQLVIRPHIVPLLPTFHGMESENPYSHIKEFEEDKAKIWLNSLRPRSIRNWVDLQAEFLKKYFPTHRTNGLKRQISNFSAKENEKFHECWERYMEASMLVLIMANNSASYGNTYNSSWRNHPNFSWKPRPPPYQPQGQTQAPQQPSSVEQAIANLSKVMNDFVGEQRAINSQLHQKIENVESSLNKRMDGMQNDLYHKIDNIQYSISRLTNLNTVNEKGKFPSQPSQNPKGVHEIKGPLIKEGKNQEEQSGKKSASKSSIEEEPRIVIKEDMMKKHMPPPFPQALHGKKEIKNSSEILEVLRQVKVNIPLLDMIKQVPTYAKFLKDLCTVKRGLQVTKNAFLTEQVSAIIQSKSPVKYKDPGCPTISVNIGGTHVEKAL
ncbi:hypothetical protein CK203_040394 [Vitis vinifera]|uniref:Retrotransposon gag domain-containing protein n=1 Tax=Vitis vinifera TaxID=29760 RepID=A0A438FX12_VITVI|nr:hypothetical protein CK203_040394 [Vitis vinifera]